MSLLNSLSARRHCHFVAQLAAKLGVRFSQTQDLIAKLESSWKSSRQKPNKRRSCRHWKSKVNHFRKLFRMKDGRKLSVKKVSRLEFIRKELPSLYNNLPLPFQCEMLFEIGRRSVLKPFDASENSVNSVSKMSLYEVGNIIKKSEKALLESVSIVRVADRCIKVLAGKKYRTTDMIISVELVDDQVKTWKRGFRAKMQWIMGRFAEHNRIKLDDLHNMTSQHNLPYSAYFTHLLNSSIVGRRLEVKFHMHLIKANSRALEARFVLAALDALNKKDLMKILDVSDVRYRAVDHFIGTGISSIQSYTLKMLFPTYLRKFFNDVLQKHERCLVKYLVTQYSNSSNERVMEFLKRKRIDVDFPCSIMNGVMSVVLSPKRNRENEVVLRKTDLPVGRTTPHTLEFYQFWKIGGKNKKRVATSGIEQIKKKYVHYRKATMVEIVMFVLLGSLSIVLVIFFITCILYIFRRRRLRKHLPSRQNERTELDGPPQRVAETSRNVAQSFSGSSSERQVVSGASRGQNEIQYDCTSTQRDGVVLRDKRSSCEKIINVTLEPLRFSTDDEESRCDDEDSPRFSPKSRIFEPSSLYLGGKRLVPAVRFSKALARKRARSNSECTVLEKVPEKGVVEIVPTRERNFELEERDEDVQEDTERSETISEANGPISNCSSKREGEGLKIHKSNIENRHETNSTLRHVAHERAANEHVINEQPVQEHVAQAQQSEVEFTRKGTNTCEEECVDLPGCPPCQETLDLRRHSVKEKSRYNGCKASIGSNISKANSVELPRTRSNCHGHDRMRQRKRKSYVARNEKHSRSSHAKRKHTKRTQDRTYGLHSGYDEDSGVNQPSCLPSVSSPKSDLEDSHGVAQAHLEQYSSSNSSQSRDLYMKSNSKRCMTV